MASDEEIHDLPFGASMFLQVACQRIFSKIEVVVIALLVIALDRSIYLQTLNIALGSTATTIFRPRQRNQVRTGTISCPRLMAADLAPYPHCSNHAHAVRR